MNSSKDSAEKTIKRQCPDHGEYDSKFMKLLGNREIYSLCPLCSLDREKRQEEERRLEAEDRRKAIMKVAGISKRFLNSSFESFKTTKDSKKQHAVVKRYCDEFKTVSEKGISMILCGKPGTGKTHLACAMVKELIKARYHPKITTSYKMLAHIKSTYDRNNVETEKEAMDKYINYDLLIIDEVGVQFGSDAEKILFYQIINGRYEEVKPTVMISNLDKESVRDFIGDRCFDRMKEGGGPTIVFGWESYRK